jgi:C1A family cysteine protease
MQKYGWHPDLPDHRDQLFCHIIRTQQLIVLPTKVDIRDRCSPVENQGELGSCTANALVGALEYLENTTDLAFNPEVFMDLSRLFVYYNERVIEQTVDHDAGAQLRDGIKALARWGTCSEREWAYDICKFTVKPSIQSYRDALVHRITSYHRLLSLNDMRDCLAQGFPFAFGFTVYESFESSEVAQTGIAQLPSINEQAVGGHAVLAVGYDDAAQRVLVRNSWGTGWGQKGYFTMPYAYISNPNLARDMWTIRK